MELPLFNEALRRLEPTLTEPIDDEKPCLTARTLRYWRAGELPQAIQILISYPELLKALCDDLATETVNIADPL